MKTIRQKAKDYDKALEIVRPYYEEAIKLEKTASAEFLESMFDELRNNDEKIRKEINNSQITIGTKICLKTNTNVILNIISDDCHEDKFECSNGSVLSLKQIEKYYDIII